MSTGDGIELDEDVLTRVRECLSGHPVSFALIFGSVAREEAREGSDLDLAVEFESLRPEDDGYSDTYLRLRSALGDALPGDGDVDVVDVHSLPPSFAQVVFDDGFVILGPEERRVELERELAGDRPSVTDARNRVSAAAERLRERRGTDHGTLTE